MRKFSLASSYCDIVSLWLSEGGVRQTMLCLLYYIALKVMASRFASEVGELVESLKKVAL